jgi:purine-binding chemotaxis protein CheW
MVSSSDFVTAQSPNQELDSLQVREGDLHLRFLIGSGAELALPATSVREVLAPAPDRITPIPNTSPLILGVLNLRGQSIWVADLGQFLGDDTPLNTDRNEIPVVAVEFEETLLGLAVDRVVGTDWLASDHMQISMNAPDAMAPFVAGEWLMADPQEEDQPQHPLRLLDILAVLRSPRWGT